MISYLYRIIYIEIWASRISTHEVWSQVMVKPLGHAYNCHLNHVLQYLFVLTIWRYRCIYIYTYIYMYTVCVHNMCIYIYTVYTHQWELDFCSFLTSPDVGCIFWVHKKRQIFLLDEAHSPWFSNFHATLLLPKQLGISIFRGHYW